MNFAELGGERGLFSEAMFWGRFPVTKAWLSIWAQVWEPVGYDTRNSVWIEVGSQTLDWNTCGALVWEALDTQEFIHAFD